MTCRQETWPVLDTKSLLGEAVDRTGLWNFGSSSYRVALESLTASLNTEARLNQAGRTEARHTLLTGLINRLRLHEGLRRSSAAGCEDLAPPVFIIGLPRTGSTLLHALLACHPDLHAPRLWELMHPVSRDGETDRDLIIETRRYVADYYRAAPDLLPIHEMGAEDPHECEWLMTTDFRNAVLGIIGYRVPSYASWLLEQDLTDAYQAHRDQLRLITTRRPGGTLLLKSPSHVWHLPSLAAVYPDARLIFLHRNRVEAIASACSLALHARRRRSDDVDPLEIGQQLTHASRLALTRQIEFSTSPPPGISSIDVQYGDLTSDPQTVAHRVFRFLRLPITSGVEHACATFIQDHPQHQHGAHTYTPQSFGISAE
jgi:sulfotransferase family protein